MVRVRSGGGKASTSRRPGAAIATALLILAPVACGASAREGGDEYVDEDFPPLSCDTEGTTTGCETSTGAPVATCEQSSECAVGVCVAEFTGEIGRFECHEVCIEPMDDAQWCADASACCDAAAICDRGYCIVEGGATAADSSSTGGTGTGDETSTGGTGDGTSSGDATSTGDSTSTTG